jgi:hypothetical protein
MVGQPALLGTAAVVLLSLQSPTSADLLLLKPATQLQLEVIPVTTFKLAVCPVLQDTLAQRRRSRVNRRALGRHLQAVMLWRALR